MKVTVIPIIIVALGIISKGFVRGLEKLEIGERVETIVKVGQNTESSSGNLGRLALSQIPGEDH